jgi:preprotein translocase subunit SecG
MLGILLQIASIVVSLLLIVLILLQVRGGGLGSMMGGDSSSVQRTRRGLEKTLYQVTIGLCIVFIGISILSFAFYN